MQLTLSKLGFRGTWLPWRNVRSRLYDGAWERWRIVCLAALSVEDIDIYLFGTMITGILLIGLGFALGYRRIQKTGTAVQSPTSLPVWLKLWEERSALSTETIIAIWILPRRSSRLYKGKMIIWRPKWTESSLQKLECVYSPQRQKILSFSGSPTVALARLLLQSTPGVQCSETLLRSSPTLQTLQTFFLMFMLYFSSILLAFHYWLYSVWLCMWRIIKNLELRVLTTFLFSQ